jgi:FkbM family methyltransferase
MNSSPKLTQRLVERRVLATEPFSLVDVGASNGIHQHWRHFGDSLQADAFEPLIKEVDRLNAIEPNPSVRYHARLVGCRHLDPAPDDVFSTDPHYRTSSVRAMELQHRDFIRDDVDQTHDGTMTTELIELDEFFAAQPADVDFVKVDTDGTDFAVLLGGRKLLSQAGPVGLAVEAPLVGCTHRHGNVFRHIDEYLQDLGYSLFSIEPRFYTRAALPKPFRWSAPWDTHAGQVRWADTLYFRDVCIPGYERRFHLTLSPHKLLKLCCAYEIFSYEDCAAEVLLTYRDRIQAVVDVDECLDLLTPPLPDGRVVTYREYIDFFEHNIEAFYSGN